MAAAARPALSHDPFPSFLPLDLFACISKPVGILLKNIRPSYQHRLRVLTLVSIAHPYPTFIAHQSKIIIRHQIQRYEVGRELIVYSLHKGH